MRTDYLAVALGAQPRAVGSGASTVGGLLRFVGGHDAGSLWLHARGVELLN